MIVSPLVIENVVASDTVSVQMGTAEPDVHVDEDDDSADDDGTEVTGSDAGGDGLFSFLRLLIVLPSSSNASVRFSTISIGGSGNLTLSTKFSTTLVAQLMAWVTSLMVSMMPETMLRRCKRCRDVNSYGTNLFFKFEHSGRGSGLLGRLLKRAVTSSRVSSALLIYSCLCTSSFNQSLRFFSQNHTGTILLASSVASGPPVIIAVGGSNVGKGSTPDDDGVVVGASTVVGTSVLTTEDRISVVSTEIVVTESLTEEELDRDVLMMLEKSVDSTLELSELVGIAVNVSEVVKTPVERNEFSAPVLDDETEPNEAEVLVCSTVRLEFALQVGGASDSEDRSRVFCCNCRTVSEDWSRL